MTSLSLMYSTAILDQVNLFLRTLMRILRFLRTLRRVLRKNPETVVPPILLCMETKILDSVTIGANCAGNVPSNLSKVECSIGVA